MELYHLKTFVTVAELGHLTRAAERLNTSQPAVSAHIKVLEEELGVQLFLRTPKGMQLTRAGSSLKSQADKTLNAVEQLRIQARDHQDMLSGQLRIGLNSDPQTLRIKELYQGIQKISEQIELRFQQAISGTIAGMVARQELDGGFVLGPCETDILNVTALECFNLVIVGSGEMRGRLEQAEPEEVASLPWIGNPPECPYGKIIDKYFKDRGLELNRVVSADQEAAILSMVSAGIGLGAVLEHEACEGMKQGTLAAWSGRSFPIQLSFVASARRRQDPLIEALLNVLQEVWHDSLLMENVSSINAACSEGSQP